MKRLLILFSNARVRAVSMLRVSIFVVMAWIGGLKVFQYEADGIVPFVANSPLMSFFYTKPAPEYAGFKNPEGMIVNKNIDWHRENGTYLFSYVLGSVIVVIGTLALSGIWYPKAGFIGGFLTSVMSLVTLSFLITTPEAYVPNLGGDYETPRHGFPFLSGVGRLVIKDVIMLGAGLVIASESAQRILIGLSNGKLISQYKRQHGKSL